MGVEKINPVERAWPSRDTKSKRPAREEMVVPDKKKEKDAKKDNTENADREVIGRNAGVMAIEQAASAIYAKMKQQELKKQLEEREEKENQAEESEKQEER